VTETGIGGCAIMMLTQKMLDDITAEIQRKNKEIGPHAIPHSDQLAKFIQSSLGIPAESGRLAIRLLLESHRILSMEIVADDQSHKIERVEGYITADLTIITQLKHYFQDLLCQLYEKQFHKRLMIHQLIKELFPIIKTFNNTELGQIANKAIMLNEYERMVDRDFEHYSTEYQEKTLVEIATRERFDYTPKIASIKGIIHSESAFPVHDTAPAANPVGNSFNRAIDSHVYKEFAEKKDHYPIQRILNIYGIDFFLKVNFRKYQFDQIRKLVDDKQITRRDDLIAVKTMLDTIKQHLFVDKELERRREDIYSLERAVSHAIYFTSSPPPRKR
jgi:F0F1-type ATP synthase delta subunit